MEIARLLSSRSDSVKLDKMLFQKWEEGSISTSAVIRQFRRNNLQPDTVEIPQDEMIDFMHSLGYLRKEER